MKKLTSKKMQTLSY